MAVKNKVIKIAITPENIFEGEGRYITLLCERDWDYVHLRHPSASLTEMRKLIESVPQKYHKKLKLHGHFELMNHFNLGGVHLNKRCPLPPSHWSGGLSKSMHQIEEVMDCGDEFDYVTLSPVFDSISKKGYGSQIDLKAFAERRNAIKTKVVALAGIEADRIADLKLYGFDGYAVLGAIFKELKSEEEFIKEIEKFK